MLSIGLSQSLTLTQRLSQELKLSASQRHIMLLTLLQGLRGKQMNTEAKCFHCGFELSKEDILKGFLDDPEDTTTKCPRCEERFQPHLIHKDPYGSYRVNFMCPDQTLHRLTDDMAEMKPKELEKANASLYHSVLANFGTLYSAFKKFGISYKYDLLQNWKEKARPFLGHYPDCMIADCVGVSRSSVQRYRQSLHIDSWKENQPYK
jgi:hypothetical protein